MTMHSKSRIHYPDAVYHVILRGKGGQEIFVQENDGHYFCLLLEEGMERFGFQLHAYCLMPDHVHIVVQVKDISCARIIRNICFRYTQYFNSIHKMKGPTFQRRPKMILFDDKNYLLELVRYIHFNPVRADIAKNPDLYPWSSHHAYLGDEAMSWVSTGWVLSRFSALTNTARERYKHYISEGSREGYHTEFHKGNGPDGILGDETFVKSVYRKAAEAQKRLLSLDETIEHVCNLYGIDSKTLAQFDDTAVQSEVRAIIAMIVQDQDHLFIAELGKRFNQNITNLHKSINRLLKRMESDPAVAENVRMIQNRLARMQAGEVLSQEIMKRQMSMEEIIEHVAGLYGIDTAVLAEPGRRPEVREARAMIALIVSNQDHLSLAELGRRLNRHTSAMPHVALRMLKRVKRNPSLAARVEIVRSQLENIHASKAPSAVSAATILSYDGIIEEVGKLYGLPPAVLAEPGIEPEHVEARSMAALIVHQSDHLSISELGRRLNRTTSTMSGAVRALLNRMITDHSLVTKVNILLDRLTQAGAFKEPTPLFSILSSPEKLAQLGPQDLISAAASYPGLTESDRTKSKRQRIVNDKEEKQPSMDRIIEGVCKLYNLTPASLAEPTYRLEPGNARAIAAFMVRHLDHLSFTELGERLNRHPRDLRGSAKRMLERVQRDYDLAKNVNIVADQLGMAHLFKLPILSSKERPLSIDDIIKTVCRVYSLSQAALAGPDRRPDIQEARAVTALIVSDQDHLSLAELGQRLNRHSSAMPHVALRMLKRVRNNPSLAERVEIVRSQLALIHTGKAPPADSTASIPSYNKIIEEVGKLYGLRPADLAEPGIEPERVEARSIAALLVYQSDHLAVSELGRRLNRTSSTMSGAVKALLKRMETNPSLVRRVNIIKERLIQTEEVKKATSLSSDLSSPAKLVRQGPQNSISDVESYARPTGSGRKKAKHPTFVDDTRAKDFTGLSHRAMKRLSLDDIINLVSGLYGLDSALLAKPGTKRKPAEARAVVALMVLEQDHLSVKDLGKRFNRYPADLSQIGKRLRKRMKTNPFLAEKVETARERLKHI